MRKQSKRFGLRNERIVLLSTVTVIALCFLIAGGLVINSLSREVEDEKVLKESMRLEQERTEPILPLPLAQDNKEQNSTTAAEIGKEVKKAIKEVVDEEKNKKRWQEEFAEKNLELIKVRSRLLMTHRLLYGGDTDPEHVLADALKQLTEEAEWDRKVMAGEKMEGENPYIRHMRELRE